MFGPDGMSPHVVVMTATPIPRTAALATVGDLDVLTLRESPGRRAGVTSFVVPEQQPAWEQRMWARAGEEIAAAAAGEESSTRPIQPVRTPRGKVFSLALSGPTHGGRAGATMGAHHPRSEESP